MNVVSGQVSINRGKGFKPVVKTTQANVGDQVMVRPDSQAKIVYSEGCAVEVNPGAVVGVAGSCKVAMAKPMTAGLEAAGGRDSAISVGGSRSRDRIGCGRGLHRLLPE